MNGANHKTEQIKELQPEIQNPIIDFDSLLKRIQEVVKESNEVKKHQKLKKNHQNCQKEKKMYDNNVKKLDHWKNEIKMNFELALSPNQSDSENDEVFQDMAYFKEMLNYTKVQKTLHKMKNHIKLTRDIEYLDAKHVFLKKIRRNHFSFYADQTKSKDKMFNQLNSFSQFMSQKRVNLSNNGKKIEKALLKICDLIQGKRNDEDDPIEQYILKKNKTSIESYQQKINKYIGYKPSDFRKLKQYKFDVFRIPNMGSNFEEAKKTVIPQFHQIHNYDGLEKFKQLNQQNKNILQNQKSNFAKTSHKALRPIKIQEELTPVPIEPTSSPLRIKHFKQDMYNFYEEIPFNNSINTKEKDQSIQKLSKMPQDDIEKYQQHQIKKAWKIVVKDIQKVYRFAQRCRQDTEQNRKRFAHFCSKEVKRRYQKSQKTQKEFQFRAKRMHREMIVYWRKREKELNEIKKRQEKLEAELKRREEEEQEAIQQKKRIEYLLKQSQGFADIMAKKLGLGVTTKEEQRPKIPQQITTDGNTVDNQQQPQQQTYDPLMFRGKRIEIDENKAAEDVLRIITETRSDVQKFDQESMLERGEQIRVKQLDKITVADIREANNMDFTHVGDDSFTKVIHPPPIFNGNLKEYQLKGLRWLDNLYEQGINGILADEMGLGKTIQAISLFGHIAFTKGIWGPFLVIAPATTLYSWQQELKKFLPTMKVLPFWGSQKQRKTIRKFFSSKNLGKQESSFHIVITSYQLVVTDEKTFHRLKWQYMILDEAQAIKNINSQRWKTLLSFNSRNKLLLTGTPIQNNMAELWALLHFIMPKLFDSHEQFQEWFSKDIEAQSTNDKHVLSQNQLQRLHAILKPFMLRRIKKDVEHELGQKIEKQIICEMTKRQQRFYDYIRSKLSLKDFFKIFESRQKVDNLMNLVMQFRKVCNHPELFERRPNRSPFVFKDIYNFQINIQLKTGDIKTIQPTIKNPIYYQIPKLIYDEIIKAESKVSFIKRKLNFFGAERVQNEIWKEKNSIFVFLRYLDLPFNFLELAWNTDEMFLAVIILHAFKRQSLVYQMYGNQHQPEKYKFFVCSNFKNSFYFNKQDYIGQYFSNQQIIQIQKPTNLVTISQLLTYQPKNLYTFIPRITAPLIQFHSSSASFTAQNLAINASKLGNKILFGDSMTMKYTHYNVPLKLPKQCKSLYPAQNIFEDGILRNPFQESFSKIEIVDFNSLVADSAKLKYLDKLLFHLKKNGNRVLIFCQMTRMLDILEDFMNKKKYVFFRLDGSCNIADRRDMVSEFQTNSKIFAFLLSTRAGGLGVTLTAADTVVFYDNDWNPTMDAQATDRAHRIGQTKDVHVYRLVTKGTIEERIVKRAQQKQQVQSTVYSGGAFKADIWKPSEVMELLFDENDLDPNQTKMFMQKQGAKKPKKKQPKKEIQELSIQQKQNKQQISIEIKKPGGRPPKKNINGEEKMEIENDDKKQNDNNKENQQDDEEDEAEIQPEQDEMNIDFAALEENFIDNKDKSNSENDD